MDFNSQQLAEIDQLLSVAAFGKDRLENLANQCLTYEQGLLTINDRNILKKFLNELRVLSATLLTTIKSVADWRVKVWSVQDSIKGMNEDESPKKSIEEKVQQLLQMLESQENRLNELQTRFNNLEQSAIVKAGSLKTTMVRGKQVIMSAAVLEA